MSDRGSAVVDFIGFGVLLQISVLMFSTFALSVQHQQFALEAIARHGIRAHVLIPDRGNTTRVISELVADFGLKPSDIEWSLRCNPDPNCVEPGSIALLQIKLGGLSAEAVQGI
ncbi:MAG: hypothetical protein F2552_00395 [Actinobacteria bacterium]|jgi:hypothetical protein|nr:hypothetical protein [Actinomycetota bacterium]